MPSERARRITGQQTAVKAGPKGAGDHYGGDLFNEVQRYAALAAEVARNESFDVVHAHDWMTFPAGMAVAALKLTFITSAIVVAINAKTNGGSHLARGVTPPFKLVVMSAASSTGIPGLDGSSGSSSGTGGGADDTSGDDGSLGELPGAGTLLPK